MKWTLSRTILTLILGTGMVSVSMAQNTRTQDIVAGTRAVTVTGYGSIRAQPDMATVRFGVVTIDVDPEAARSQNASASAAAMNAIRALGVEDRKIRLDVLRLEPFREYDAETRRYIDKGFQAVRQVSVRLEDLDLLPAMIAEVVQQGANRIQGITYGIQDREAYEFEALRDALESARSKAGIMVETLGAELGTVLRIREQGVNIPAPQIQFERAMSAKADAPEPAAYASGEMEITATVSVSFAIRSDGRR